MNNFCFHCEASRHGVRWGAFEYVGAGVGECVYGGREHSVNSKGNKREARNSVGQEKSKKSKV